jgi:amino acid transporter
MDQTSANQHAAAMAALAGSGFALIVVAVAIIFFVLIYWRVAAKAGYNGALSLLMFVPLVNFIMVLIFAFSEWPIERKLKALEAGGAGTSWTPQPMNPPSLM